MENQLLKIAHETIPFYSNQQRKYNNWNSDCQKAVNNRNKAQHTKKLRISLTSKEHKQ